MKSQIFHHLQTEPRLRRRDLWLTIVPILLWMGSVYARPYLIQARCVSHPETCTPATVLSFDQPGLGLDSTRADELSNVTQQLSGYLAAITPAIWNGALAALGTVSPAAALANAGTDFVLVLETVAWNGALNESAKLLIQRPRPYVYASPTQGQSPSNYTSFYSGHTSFAAAACFALLFVLLGRHAPTWVLLLAGGVSQGIILATAAFRVLAGRHFLTDVIVGTIAGTLVALAIAALHRPRLAPGLLSVSS